MDLAALCDRIAGRGAHALLQLVPYALGGTYGPAETVSLLASAAGNKRIVSACSIDMRQASRAEVAGSRGQTYTFMPCQKLCELLWSHVYTMHARTCFPVPL
jgi:hypothetical protein